MAEGQFVSEGQTGSKNYVKEFLDFRVLFGILGFFDVFFRISRNYFGI